MPGNINININRRIVMKRNCLSLVFRFAVGFVGVSCDGLQLR